SIWPAVEDRVLDLVEAHRSTIVFANSRRLAERLTSRLNELAYERRHGAGPDEAAEPQDLTDYGGGPPHARMPAELMGQSGSGAGAPVVVARAHHGSVSKEQRAVVEEELKS